MSNNKQLKILESLFGHAPKGYQYKELVHFFSVICEEYKQDSSYLLSDVVFRDCHVVYQRA